MLVSISPQTDPTTETLVAGPLRLTSLFLRGRARRQVMAALRANHLRVLSQTDLLAPARLPGLARDSLSLLVAGGAFFAIINIIAWDLRQVDALPGPNSLFVRLFLLVMANLVAYALILPLHEVVHAATILLLGGRARFGLRLPLAAYCTAPNQVFTRAGYAAVALAPFFVLSALGVVITILAPQWATWLWFGFAGNIAGAVGDLVTASEVRQMPPGTLIADNEAGFTAYTIDDGD
jgi:Putative zincin peptidase